MRRRGQPEEGRNEAAPLVPASADDADPSGKNKAPRDEEQLPFGDELRARMRASQLGKRYPSKFDNAAPIQCGPFNRLDLLVFIFLGILLWAYVKAEHRIDLAKHLWEYVKPDYDEGHFDDL